MDILVADIVTEFILVSTLIQKTWNLQAQSSNTKVCQCESIIYRIFKVEDPHGTFLRAGMSTRSCMHSDRDSLFRL